jgi:hypothetical protein
MISKTSFDRTHYPIAEDEGPSAMELRVFSSPLLLFRLISEMSGWIIVFNRASCLLDLAFDAPFSPLDYLPKNEHSETTRGATGPPHICAALRPHIIAQ